MSDNRMGEMIRSLRKRAHMTQEELAEGICSPVSVSRIENGTQMPSNSVLEALLDRLGTSTYQICNVYYQTDRQLAFDREADQAAEFLRAGRLPQAKEKLAVLEKTAMSDPVNMQYYLLLEAAVMLSEGADRQKAMSSLHRAIAITKPSLDLDDVRNALLTVREANILNLIAVLLFQSGEIRRAIHLGEDLYVSLKKHISAVSGYRLLQVNVAFNLAQYMEKEHRYQEAFLYCQEAEDLSMNSQEQMLLPEIQFIKAKILHLLGDDAESSAILKAVIPYMELVKKSEFAAMARDYARKELHLII